MSASSESNKFQSVSSIMWHALEKSALLYNHTRLGFGILRCVYMCFPF
jgi:hypothetical protein